MVEGVFIKILYVGQAINESFVFHRVVEHGLHKSSGDVERDFFISTKFLKCLFEVGNSQEKDFGRIFFIMLRFI